jgi:hypothetical protein
MDGANPSHLSRALAFVLVTFLLNLAAVLFIGLQRPSHGPEGGFGIVRVVPVCPQLQNKFLLQIEDFESASQALVRILQIAVGEDQGLQSHPIKPEWNVRSLCRLSEWWET